MADIHELTVLFQRYMPEGWRVWGEWNHSTAEITLRICDTAESLVATVVSPQQVSANMVGAIQFRVGSGAWNSDATHVMMAVRKAVDIATERSAEG